MRLVMINTGHIFLASSNKIQAGDPYVFRIGDEFLLVPRATRKDKTLEEAYPEVERYKVLFKIK